MQRSNRFLRLVSALTALLFVTAAGIFAWRYLLNPCDEQAVKAASAFLTSQQKAYDDLYQFTTSVHPDGLNPPLTKMQQIFMDTQAVSVPVCLRTAKEELLAYMETVIHAFQAFAAGETDRKIRELIDQAYQHYDNFKAELEAVNACAPFCIP